MSYSLMDKETQLLVERNFSLTREIHECTQTNEFEGNQSNHLVNNFNPSKDVDLLLGKKLRLTLLEEPPFVIFERHPNGSIIGYKGYCYEIVRLLQTMYNLTYEFILPSDHSFGKEMPNGSWNGMIGMVVEQVVDIGLGPFSVTHSRSKVVDFSVGFYEDGNAILIPPAAEENRLLACTKPFRLETWLTLLSFAIILPIILWHYSNLFAIHYQERRSTLTKQYLFILGVLIGQSGQKLPSVGFSSRSLGAIWCLNSVVFASAYIGILMSFLRFPKLLPIINQLEELPGSHLKWVVQRGTALDTLFLEATTGVYKTIGDGLLNPQRGSLINVNEDGAHHVTSGSYAYIAGKSNLESLMYDDYTRTGICRLSIAQQEFFKINVAFAFPKNSPLKPFMDKKILQMVEAGLGIYWKKLYWPPSDGKCGKVKQSGPKSLSLIDLQGAFIILAIGSGIAFIIFLIERFPPLSIICNLIS
ncbi:glutamate receptor ionotropic, kainate 2-like [Daphnia carinata]|uniref:glutamate receptor ionotropic, kainate 2-like n=1 Tax=Daphnia carinata TaxID=120202 RepID=UPI00257E081E|nr:glutamate receptor ionotropic, kainate 2-like [Daphnia carinata]